MSETLKNSMMHQVFFPHESGSADPDKDSFSLRRKLVFRLPKAAVFSNIPLTIFDFETTGLNSQSDIIIEIGAIKVENFKVVDTFEALCQPGIPLSPKITEITGITDDMLKGKPRFEDIWSQFTSFIASSVLVAHNAQFDLAFLKSHLLRCGIDFDWDCFCTLKMARAVHPELESKNLDSLANHYGLEFEARHRSIGDCKVTLEVLRNMLENAAFDTPETWQDIEPYKVS